MYYFVKVIKDNIIVRQIEFDKKREIDLKKVKKEFEEKYPQHKIEVE